MTHCTPWGHRWDGRPVVIDLFQDLHTVHSLNSLKVLFNCHLSMAFPDAFILNFNSSSPYQHTQSPFWLSISPHLSDIIYILFICLLFFSPPSNEAPWAQGVFFLLSYSLLYSQHLIHSKCSINVWLMYKLMQHPNSLRLKTCSDQLFHLVILTTTLDLKKKDYYPNSADEKTGLWEFLWIM